ncbi:hypothetical protein ACC807_26260 [Rhizobium ruizarguesonis]|uniref:hypothetical protein n=1 Tax=Rhizobium ruizarguesonis TaxID=2081791 RepID=UPI0010324C14|nr:hypothetical protein [Rhizobium ruizarguesonis]TBA63762.1 hypothetical protein ELH57_08705 [Rhizobium ruizarguesonis]TBY90638.1 hypothetical protein E0H40_13840 [Rhizobium leguminosarum bv. viciae]
MSSNATSTLRSFLLRSFGAFGGHSETVPDGDRTNGIYHTGRQRRAVSELGKVQLHSMTLETTVEHVV